MDHPCSTESCPLRLTASSTLGRRSFLVQSLIATAGSMLAAACGTGTWETGPKPSITDLGDGGYTIAIADYPALAQVGGIAKVAVAGGSAVAVVRRAESQYDAFWMSCPHQGTTIAIQRDGFTCPNHGARFDESGTWVGGQATGNLSLVPFTYDPVARTIKLGVAPPPVTHQRPPMVLDVVLATVPEMAAVGGIALFGLGNGYPAALVRLAEESYHALSPICPHKGWYVEAAAAGFECPGHHARFSARGVWQGGQATTDLTLLDSTYDATRGVVSITIP